MDSPNNTIIDVPIPSELAELDLSLSLQNQNSSGSVAIESLIQQNIDLTTRLNINIRRVNELEQAYQQYQNQFTQFQTQKEAFKEEIQVLHKRFQTQESLVISYRIDKENAEKAYAHLVIDHRSLKDRIEGERLKFLSRIHRLEQYRRRIREIIKPLFKQYKNDSDLVARLQSKVSFLERYRSKMKKHIRPWVKSLKYDLSAQKEKAEKQEIKAHELGLRIQDLLTHLKTKTQEFEQDQKTLVEYHEKRFSTASKELELYKADFEHLKQKMEQMTLAKAKFEDANAALENRTIHAERRLHEVETSYQSDIQRLQQAVKSAEELWVVGQKNTEMLESHITAAQRLNQKLSEEMQDARKENELLRLRIRQTKLQSETDLIQAHNLHKAELMRLHAQIPSPIMTIDVPKPVMNGTEALFQNPTVPQTLIEEENEKPEERIEDLMAEIQSGHSKKSQAHTALGSSPLPSREDFGDLL